MADNVAVTPGSGASIATDDVGGVQYQRVKLDVGGDGTSTPVVGGLPVKGDVAHDAADSGAPVKTGGKANSSAPTAVAAGDRVDAWHGLQGQLAVVLVNSLSGSPSQIESVTPGDAIAQSHGLRVVPYNHVFNGTTWDRLRGTATDGVLVDLGANNDVVAGGPAAHDAAASGNPLLAGAAASAAAPSAVSGDGDVVRLWALRNGALAVQLTAGGALVGGDATNGVDVDVTRVPKPGTAAVTSVSDSASSATLLAATAGRMGFTVYNDSTQALYLKYGTTASATDFTVIVPPGGFYEDRYSYTGRVDGIWAADASGAARITELTA